MKKTQLFVAVILLLVSCNYNSKSISNVSKIKFNSDNAITFKLSEFQNILTSLNLETTNNSLVSQNDVFSFDKNFFFFLSRNNGKVIRFNKLGKFINSIGGIGNGPNEYLEPSDLYINEKDNQLEILAFSGIFIYNYDGQFVKKNKINDIPAFSFAIDNMNNYWLSTGNNKAYSDYKLFKLDSNNTIEKHNKSEENLLPVIEKALTKCPGGIITYTESLSDKVFVIENNVLTETFQIDFGNYHLPEKNEREDSQKFFELMRKRDFCQIRNYFENNDFAYFFIIQNLNSERKLNFFHLFVRKANNEQFLYKVDNVNMNSYAYYPKGLTDDNKLIFVGGYNNNNSIDENPSIVFLSMDKLLK